MAIGPIEEEWADTLLSILYTMTAAVSVGMITMSIWGVDLLEPITTVDRFVLDYATLGSLFALGVAWWVNRPTLSNLDGTYQLLLLATVGLVVYGSYEPGFASDMSELIQIALVGIQIGGYWVIGQN